MNKQTKQQKDGFDPKVAAEAISKHGSKSEAIRALLKSGKSRSEVAVMLGLRYQHVRNVEITPIKNPKPAPSKRIGTEEDVKGL